MGLNCETGVLLSAVVINAREVFRTDMDDCEVSAVFRGRERECLMH